MIIDLANVGTVAKEIEVAFEPGDIDLEGETVTLTGTTHLAGEIQRVNDRVTLEGTIRADVSVDCTRCLEPLARRLDIPFRAIFVDSSEEDATPEGEVADDKLDESIAEDGRIGMADVVREQILLAMPEQLFCRDDCKGLCPQCGASLNLIDCKCAGEESDPRWAALKELK